MIQKFLSQEETHQRLQQMTKDSAAHIGVLREALEAEKGQVRDAASVLPANHATPHPTLRLTPRTLPPLCIQVAQLQYSLSAAEEANNAAEDGEAVSPLPSPKKGGKGGGDAAKGGADPDAAARQALGVTWEVSISPAESRRWVSGERTSRSGRLSGRWRTVERRLRAGAILARDEG